MHKINRIFIIILSVLIIVFSLHATYLKKTVYGDGVYYFVYLRSILFDRDINFKNEFNYLGVSAPLSPIQKPVNKFTPGPAILWLPGYSLLKPLFKGFGYEFKYQFVVGLISVFYVIAGLLLLYKTLNRFYSPIVSMLSIISILFATNLFFYSSIDVVNSHPLVFFAVCLYLALLYTSKSINFLILGISLGLISIIRLQDIVLGLLIIPFIRFKDLKNLLLGFLLVFSIQLMVWQNIYGQFRINPYLLENPAGFNFLNPKILEVLLSFQNGWFFWTPISLIGLAGLVLSREKIKKYYLLTVVFCQIYIISSWQVWWQGASYGNRMLISSLPILSLGFGSFYTKLIKNRWKSKFILIMVILPLSALNLTLMLYRLLFFN